MKENRTVMVDLSKGAVTSNLCVLADKLFSLPEIGYIEIRGLEIRRDNKAEMIKSAVEECWHDCYSDIDLCAMVRLSAESAVSPEEYVRHIGHWVFPAEVILGICIDSENRLCRIALKNGMRYDIKFAFTIHKNAPVVDIKPVNRQDDNKNWPLENVDRFWFVQIQALGKLYRDDFLISSHLANVNINETLVQQMVLRDIKYHTNHHRYGYKEEAVYSQYTGQCPCRSGNSTFDDIADRIYSASLACDELVSLFYEDHRPRSGDFFEIWKSYEAVKGQRA